MKKILNKTVSLFLCLVLLVLTLPAVFAQNGDYPLLAIEAENAVVIGGDTLQRGSAYVFYDVGNNSSRIKFSLKDGYRIYYSDVRDDTLCQNNEYTVSFNNCNTFYITNGSDKRRFSLYTAAKGENAPNAKVIDYLVAPSQYTNASSYGYFIENTLMGSFMTTSLGNYGGYAVYKFDTAIDNSKKNPYGIDFIISGNAFNGAATTQEPGQVWVSQDGKKWYALAGSEHYEDSVLWDYSVTYKNNGTNICDFEDSLGNTGAVSKMTGAMYPSKEYYPNADIPENELTLGGILLSSQRVASTANGVATKFGYVDALAFGKSNEASNPYIADPIKDGKDGQFDISWAVDENGNPVKLDWVQYVKVQTATFTDAGIFGEKSTEISSVYVTKPAKTDVGKTESVKAININGASLALQDGKIGYDVKNLVSDDGFTVSVETDENTNVYIDNSYAAEREFSALPQKGIIRIIAQSGESEPEIYYLYTGEGNHPDTPIIPDEVEEPSAPLGESVSVSFCALDGEIIMPEEDFTVDDGLAEEYGYKVAKKDHNGEPISAVTVFDLIVAAHKAYYGDSFTPETAKDYLVMNNSFITKAFGKSASSSGFLVDGYMPNDGVINELFGTYTGYACDTARLKTGNKITYYFYRDKKAWSDVASNFDCESALAFANEPLNLNIKGYCAMWYGMYPQSTIEENTFCLYGTDVYCITPSGEHIKMGTTDKNGNISVTFSQAGEYKLYTKGTCTDGDGEEYSVISSWCDVKVESRKEPQQNAWDKIENAVKTILDVAVKIFKWILSFIIGR